MKPKEIGLFNTKTHLSEIVEKVEGGQVYYITRRGRRVAELRPVGKERHPLQRGCVKNAKYWLADDFNETPADFDEYQ